MTGPTPVGVRGGLADVARHGVPDPTEARRVALETVLLGVGGPVAVVFLTPSEGTRRVPRPEEETDPSALVVVAGAHDVHLGHLEGRRHVRAGPDVLPLLAVDHVADVHARPFAPSTVAAHARDAVAPARIPVLGHLRVLVANAAVRLAAGPTRPNVARATVGRLLDLAGVGTTSPLEAMVASAMGLPNVVGDAMGQAAMDVPAEGPRAVPVPHRPFPGRVLTPTAMPDSPSPTGVLAKARVTRLVPFLAALRPPALPVVGAVAVRLGIEIETNTGQVDAVATVVPTRAGAMGADPQAVLQAGRVVAPPVPVMAQVRPAPTEMATTVAMRPVEAEGPAGQTLATVLFLLAHRPSVAVPDAVPLDIRRADPQVGSRDDPARLGVPVHTFHADRRGRALVGRGLGRAVVAETRPGATTQGRPGGVADPVLVDGDDAAGAVGALAVVRGHPAKEDHEGRDVPGGDVPARPEVPPRPHDQRAPDHVAAVPRVVGRRRHVGKDRVQGHAIAAPRVTARNGLRVAGAVLGPGLGGVETVGRATARPLRRLPHTVGLPAAFP